MLNKSMDIEQLAAYEQQEILETAEFNDDPLEWLLAEEKAREMFEMFSEKSASET